MVEIPSIELRDVTVAYDDGPPVLRNFDLYVDDREFLGLLGPSGSGKSTIIRVIAGLERPSSGQVIIDGEDVTRLPPAKRNLAVVFQDWALYPHLSAGGNMGFPMKVKGDEPAAIAQRVGQVAATLALSALLDRRPGELSAGHKHGVATGRALVGKPRLLMMDEPLANLDAKLRRQVRTELSRIHREQDVTVLYATNDQEEALTLADRVAVIDGGALQQAAAPQAIYRRPLNTFVATFVGTPAMNLLRAGVIAGGDGVTLLLGSRRIDVPADEVAKVPALLRQQGREVVVGIRPEQLRYGGVALPAGQEQRVGGEVSMIEFLGSDQLVYFSNDAIAADGTPGAEWVARLPADAPVRRGEHVALAVDVDRLCYFDPADGEALR